MGICKRPFLALPARARFDFQDVLYVRVYVYILLLKRPQASALNIARGRITVAPYTCISTKKASSHNCASIWQSVRCWTGYECPHADIGWKQAGL